MLKLPVLIILLLGLSACSMDRMMVKASMPMIESGIVAMNQETDLQLAEDAMPANIGMLNGLISMDPDNVQLHVYAAQAYYGLAYGFTEDDQAERASRFYQRGLKHGLKALALLGLDGVRRMHPDDLETQLRDIGKAHVDALFWTASNWAKWIDLNRDDAASLIQLPKPTAMMQRVLELDESFYYGSAHMYFGVYYGARAEALGGDFARAKKHFDRARQINDNRLLIVDLLQAQYLSRQMFDRDDFHRRLTAVLQAPEDLYPELALLNQIAKRKARLLLTREDEWF